MFIFFINYLGIHLLYPNPSHFPFPPYLSLTSKMSSHILKKILTKKKTKKLNKIKEKNNLLLIIMTQL